jgi:hypothetical protein
MRRVAVAWVAGCSKVEGVGLDGGIYFGFSEFLLDGLVEAEI